MSVDDRMNALEDRQHETALLLERVSQQMQRLSTDVDDTRDAVFSQDSARPGLLMRQAEVERRIVQSLQIVRWTFGGGLAVALASLWTLIALFDQVRSLLAAGK